MNTTFSPEDRVTTPRGNGTVLESPFQFASGWTVLVDLDDPHNPQRETRYRFPLQEVTPEVEEPEPTWDALPLIAHTALAAQPGLTEAIAPDATATEYWHHGPTTTPLGQRTGYLEARITWEATTGNRIQWTVTIALEPRDGVTVEDQSTATTPTGELAWVDLARHIAAQLAALRAEADTTA